MAKRLNIAVLMGGRTAEHEISLISGSEVVMDNAVDMVISQLV